MLTTVVNVYVTQSSVHTSPILTVTLETIKSIVRNGNFWISNLFTSNDSSDYNDSSNYSYLIYPHCPLDYCQPSASKIALDLSKRNASDLQCAFNRSGLLCGTCKTGLSLSLGSSQCVACSNTWPTEAVVVVIVFLILGIALVTLVLVLNLTVSTGTLNGLVFYVNIIDACIAIFFPSNSTKVFYTLFLFNLKPGRL